MIVFIVAALLLWQAVSPPVAPVAVLEGAVGGTDKGTYQEHSFDVPEGTTRIDFTFEHSHKDVGAQLEVGVFDPVRFRGTSRFSKTTFYIADTHATPSYHAGPLPPGRWRVSLGVPALGTAPKVEWTITIHKSSAASTASPQPRTGDPPRWFTGDFHAHTLHSDGFGCTDPKSPTATRGCHTWEIVEAAQARALDFVAITDHNTTSHHAEMAALQQTRPDLLLLRGQELTTFHGHANVYGTSAYIDFRLGFRGRTMTDVMADIDGAGGHLSINHPGRETGDRCTGCGWDAPATPWARVHTMEVVNGTTIDGPTAGLWFWQARLNEGHRITAIGGSDDHAVTSIRGRLGTPATVVFADRLSEESILAGVRAGRVYIRTRGPNGPAVDISISQAGARVPMGGTVRMTDAGTETLRIDTEGAQGQHADIVMNGQVIASVPVPENNQPLNVPVKVTSSGWINVRLKDDRGITAISNPIYLVTARASGW